MSNRNRILVSVTLLLAGAAVFVLARADQTTIEIPAEDLAAGRAHIVGELGQPLGTYFDIVGERSKTPMMSDNPFSVLEVDGKKLDKPIDLDVHKAPKFKSGATYHVRGYEIGGFNTLPDDPKEPPHDEKQKTFQFVTWFVATKVGN
jgi:hypothetical protein